MLCIYRTKNRLNAECLSEFFCASPPCLIAAYTAGCGASAMAAELFRSRLHPTRSFLARAELAANVFWDKIVLMRESRMVTQPHRRNDQSIMIHRLTSSVSTSTSSSTSNMC
jgi:hypothetical protein